MTIVCSGFFQPSVGSESRFAASVTVDEELLHIAPTQLIYPEECTRIYGYTRAEHMVRKYELGKVIGAGSFGVVREATVRSSGEKVAVKTISKLLKRIPKHLQRQEQVRASGAASAPPAAARSEALPKLFGLTIFT